VIDIVQTVATQILLIKLVKRLIWALVRNWETSWPTN